MIGSVEGLTDGQIVIGMIVAIATLVSATAGLVVALRTKGAVTEVHTLTNSRVTDMVNRQNATDQRVEQLLGALNRGGIEVPIAPDRLVADHPIYVVPPSPAPLSGEGTGPLVPKPPAS